MPLIFAKAAETTFGRPPSPTIQSRVHMVPLLLLLLMIVVVPGTEQNKKKRPRDRNVLSSQPRKQQNSTICELIGTVWREWNGIDRTDERKEKKHPRNIAYLDVCRNSSLQKLLEIFSSFQRVLKYSKLTFNKVPLADHPVGAQSIYAMILRSNPVAHSFCQLLQQSSLLAPSLPPNTNNGRNRHRVESFWTCCFLSARAKHSSFFFGCAADSFHGK